MNTLELAKANPEAYQALPEPYREDDVLEFLTIEDTLYCRPMENQRHIIGEWFMYYDVESKTWDQDPADFVFQDSDQNER